MADEKQVKFKIFGGRDASVSKAFQDTGNEAEKLDKSLEKLAAKHKRAMQDVGVGAIALGAGIAAAVGVAVKSFADFDKQMSSVRAATQASSGDMDLLRAAALKAGKDTQYSAVEAAQGITELAKAGVSTKDILAGGLTGALNLAAAGEMNVSDAAQIAASTLVQFHLKGSQVAHVADLLAAGANKAMGEVSDLGFALRQAGPIASQMGLSVDDTVTALTELASAGMTGSDAGTSLKTMLMALVPTSNSASDAMKNLGLKFFDAKGNMKSFSAIAEELKTKLGGLSKEQQIAALKTIFGSDAYRAAAIVMEGGADAANKWKKEISASGYAAEVARTKTDNLTGDIERLQGSLETAAISAGSGLNTSLRGLTQGLTSTIDAFNNLPPNVQEAAGQLAAFTAASLLIGGTVITVVPKIKVFKEAIRDLGLTAGRTGTAMRLLGKSVMLVGLAELSVEATKATAGVGRAHIGVRNLDKSMQDFAKTGELGGKSLEIFKEGMGPFRDGTMDSAEALHRWREEALGAFGDDVGNKIGRFLDGQRMDRFKDHVNQLDASFADLVQSGHIDEAVKAQKRFLDAIPDEKVRGQVAGMFVQMKASMNDVIPTIDKTGKVVMTTRAALEDQAQSADDAKQALEDYKNALDAAFGYLNLQEAQDNFTKGLKDMGEAAKKAKGQIKGSSDATLELRGSIRGQVDDATNLLKVMKDQGASNEDVAKTAIKLRDRIYDAGVAAGVSGKDMKKFLKGFEDIPGVKEMELRLKTDPAMHSKKEAEAELKKIPKEIWTKLMADPTGATLKSKEARAAFKNIPPWVLTLIKANADPAIASVADFITRTNNKSATVSIYERHFAGPPSKPPITSATGGYISGPGTSTSDSIPALLSDGEYVINAASTRKNLALLEAINSGTVARFAHGGHAHRHKSPVAGQNAAISKDLGYSLTKAIRGTAQQLADAFARLLDAVAKRGNKHANALAKKYQGKMLGVARQEDRVTAKLHDAQAKLSDLKKQRADEVTSIKNKTVADAGIGTGSGHDLGSIMFKLKNDANKATKFAADIKKLRSMGLGPAAIQQITNMGVDDGMAYAEAILGGGKGAVTQINALQGTIAKAGTSLGDTVAGQMYDAGIRSAQGIVKGLQKEQKHLNDVMEKMAKQMAKALKKALGIKSPSRVFAQIGHHTAAGLIVGMEGQRAAVMNTASSLVGVASGTSRRSSGGGSGAAPVIHIHGAIDPVGTARQIRTILNRGDVRGVNGAV